MSEQPDPAAQPAPAAPTVTPAPAAATGPAQPEPAVHPVRFGERRHVRWAPKGRTTWSMWLAATGGMLFTTALFAPWQLFSFDVPGSGRENGGVVYKFGIDGAGTHGSAYLILTAAVVALLVLCYDGRRSPAAARTCALTLSWAAAVNILAGGYRLSHTVGYFGFVYGLEVPPTIDLGFGLWTAVASVAALAAAAWFADPRQATGTARRLSRAIREEPDLRTDDDLDMVVGPARPFA